MSQVSQERDRTKLGATVDARSVVSCLIKAQKDLQMYPATNPVVVESVEKIVHTLRQGFEAGDKVELLVEKDCLFLDGVSVGENEARVAKFSLSLYRRGIHKLVFNQYIEFEEMRTLLSIINLKPEEIEEAGGIASVMRDRGIIGATVEAKGELAIVNGANLFVSEKDLLEIEGLKDLELTAEQMGTPQSFSRVFAQVEGEDLASMERLRKLLENPELFSMLLEKFAVQRKAADEQVDPTSRVGNMLDILRSVGGAVASLPSGNERTQMLKNLSLSVLGLSTDSRTNLVSRGIVPNLATNNVESNILSRFPMGNLTDALYQNFKVSGGTASMMESYFKNLDFSQIDRSELAGSLRQALKQDEMLTPEVEAVLSQGGSVPEAVTAAKNRPVLRDVAIRRVKGYPPEKILFSADERVKLAEHATAGIAAPDAKYMVPRLLTLFRHERIPADLTVILERITLYMEHLFVGQNQRIAIELIKELHAELEDKKKELSESQLEPVKEAIDKIDKYLGEQGIQPRIDKLRELSRGSPEFNEILKYFASIGIPAISELFRALEEEESRHARLLICEALAHIGSKAVDTVAERVNHSRWHVVRNAVSILGQIGAPECVPYLKDALSHEEIRVRKAAMKGLAAIKTDEAVEAICSCVSSPDIETCKTALEWISVMETEQAFPMLKQVLNGEHIWKMDDDVLRLAIEALGSIDFESAIALLEVLSRKRSMFRRRKSALIRKAAGAELENRPDA